MASPLIPLTNPNTLGNPGDTVTATDWVADWSGVVNYINNTLVASWNTFQNAGDILAYNGSSIVNIPIGSNGQFLQANSSSSGGMQWASATELAALTTAGDMVYYNSGNTRLPIGTTGQILTVSAGGFPFWASGAVTIPVGGIIIWSGTIASIPTNWALCDGVSNASGVNLQGLFVVGAGNTSPAASGGMGNLSPGGPTGDNASGSGVGGSYQPGVSASGSTNTGGPSSTGSIAYEPGGYGAGFASSGHTHGVSIGVSGSAGPFTVTPKYYALCYIEFQGA